MKEKDTIRKQQLKNQLKEFLEQKKLRPQLIQEGFNKYYDFSKVLFVYDTSFTLIRKGVFTDVFVGNSPTTDIEETVYFFNKPSLIPSKNLVREVTLDKEFNVIEPPFPYVTYEGKSNRSIFTLPFINDNVHIPEYWFAQNLNLVFWRFHRKVMRKKWFK